MSGSGLIYAAVLGAWAVYFVSRAMRSGPREVIVPNEGVVLRRRGAVDAPTGTYSMIRPVVDLAAPVVKERRPDGAVAAAPTPVRISAATARRRRRMLKLLLAACLFGEIMKLAGMVSGHLAAVPVLLLLSYLVELRVQARRARAPRIAVEDFVAPAVPKRSGRGRQKEGSEFWDPWPSFDPAEAKPGRKSELADGWEPRPVPLPTYITAAKAPSVVGRRIDIPAGRAWTEKGEPAVESAEPKADRPAVAAVAGEASPTPTAQVEAKSDVARAVDEAADGATPIADDLAVEFEHKRAVND